MPVASGTIARSGPIDPSLAASVRMPWRAHGRHYRSKQCSAADSNHPRRFATTAPAPGGTRRRRFVPPVYPTLSLPRLSHTYRRQLTLLRSILNWPDTRLPTVVQSSLDDAGAGSVDRLELSAARSKSAIHRQQQPLPDSAVGACEGSGLFHSGARRQADRPRLAPTLWLQADAAGNSRRYGSIPRNLLSRCQLELCWRNFRARPDGSTSSKG